MDMGMAAKTRRAGCHTGAAENAFTAAWCHTGRRRAPAGPPLASTKLSIPMFGDQREFDRPIAKTHRMLRRVNNLRTSCCLVSRTDGYYVRLIPEALCRVARELINSNDPKNETLGADLCVRPRKVCQRVKQSLDRASSRRGQIPSRGSAPDYEHPSTKRKVA